MDQIRRIKIVLALATLPVVAGAQAGDFTVRGQLGKSEYDGQFVKLYYQQDSIRTMDSVVIKDGRFLLTGSVEFPTTAVLSMETAETGDRIDLFLSEGSVNVSTAGLLAEALVSGTSLAEDHDRLAKTYRDIERELYRGLQEFMNITDEDEKRTFFTGVSANLDQYVKVKKRAIHQFVTENPDSYVALYHLNESTAGGINFETTYPYYAKLSDRLRDTPLGKQLGVRLAAAKNDLTGKTFREFVSPTPEGNELRLSEIVQANKYVLLDFWASWCGPCRKENPYVVKTYQTFKDKGFSVLSVSLDHDREKWLAAIEADGMPWHHVSSLQGWDDPAGRSYGVRAIPQNFLISRDGTIVAVNLRGEALYERMEELLD